MINWYFMKYLALRPLLLISISFQTFDFLLLMSNVKFGSTHLHLLVAVVAQNSANAYITNGLAQVHLYITIRFVQLPFFRVFEFRKKSINSWEIQLKNNLKNCFENKLCANWVVVYCKLIFVWTLFRAC